MHDQIKDQGPCHYAPWREALTYFKVESNVAGRETTILWNFLVPSFDTRDRDHIILLGLSMASSPNFDT